MQTGISLIIPAYNEEARLAPFLDSLASFIKDHPNTIYEIILVDDGSKDRTVAVAESFIAKLPILKILRQEKNRGKGAAIRAGVMQASGNDIVFMDADGATDASEIPKMASALQYADIAVGNRFMDGALTKRHSPLRSLSGLTYRTYMGLFGLGKIDTMCGFKGYKHAVAQQLFKDLLEERWLFDTEIAYKAVQKGYKIVNFPIVWESKDGSKLPTRTLIKSAFQIWPLIRRINQQTKSLAGAHE